MSQMSHCVLEVFIKNAGGLSRSKSDALALEVRVLGNQTSRHRESAELRDAFPGLDTMQHHDLRQSERPTKGQVSLPDDGRLFVSYSPPVCTFNPVKKKLLWNALLLRPDARPVTRERTQTEMRRFGDPIPYLFQLRYCVFGLGDEGSDAVQRCGWETSAWYTPATLPSSRSSLSVLLCSYGSLGNSSCVAGRSWSVMIAVRRRVEAACRLGEPVS